MGKGIGERIKSVRQRVGAGQKDFGQHFNVSPSAVSSYEREEKTPTVETLEKIASLGGVSLDWLITGKGAAAPTQISEDDALALVVSSRPEAFGKMREKLKEEIREEQEQYAADRRHIPLTDQERALVDAFRHASEEIREEALGMLERSARRSREKDGVGSDSGKENCA